MPGIGEDYIYEIQNSTDHNGYNSKSDIFGGMHTRPFMWQIDTIATAFGVAPKWAMTYNIPQQ